MYVSKTIFKGLAVCSMACTIAFFASCNGKKSTNTKTETTTTTGEQPASVSGRIAYVDMDTLESKFIFLKNKKDEMERETKASDAEIGRMTQSLQNEYISLQKKSQAGALSQVEGEAAQKRLGQMQQNIENKKQELTMQLMKKQEAFNKDLQARLDAFLAKYNKDKGYDYILSYSKGGSILFVNTALNITEDVIKGMNAENGGTEVK